MTERITLAELDDARIIMIALIEWIGENHYNDHAMSALGMPMNHPHRVHRRKELKQGVSLLQTVAELAKDLHSEQCESGDPAACYEIYRDILSQALQNIEGLYKVIEQEEKTAEALGEFDSAQPIVVPDALARVLRKVRDRDAGPEHDMRPPGYL